MANFTTGEIVRLKSGGPSMTVSKPSTFDEDVLCQWFAGSKLNQGWFPANSLNKVEDEEQKA